MSLSNYWAVGKCLKCENKDRWVKKTAVLDKEGKLDKIVRMCAPCRLIVKYVNQLVMSGHTVFVVTCCDSCHLEYINQEIENTFSGEINMLGGDDDHTDLWLHGDVDIENVKELLWGIGYVKDVQTKIEFDDVLLKTTEKITGGKWRIGEFKERTVKTVKEGITFFRPPRELKPDKVKLPEIKVRGDTLSND